MPKNANQAQLKKQTKLHDVRIAVFESGGKQYIVNEGMQIKVEKIDEKPGKTLKTKDLLDGKEVSYQILENIKAKKISHIKFRNKTRYTKRLGHRQILSLIKILSIK